MYGWRECSVVPDRWWPHSWIHNLGKFDNPYRWAQKWEGHYTVHLWFGIGDKGGYFVGSCLCIFGHNVWDRGYFIGFRAGNHYEKLSYVYFWGSDDCFSSVDGALWGCIWIWEDGDSLHAYLLHWGWDQECAWGGRDRCAMGTNLVWDGGGVGDWSVNF